VAHSRHRSESLSKRELRSQKFAGGRSDGVWKEEALGGFVVVGLGGRGL